MRRHLVLFFACTLALATGASFAQAPSNTENAEAKAQVIAVERAFAKSMADRDLAAFATLVSEEAVFFSGPTPLRGKAAVVAFWTKFFKAEKAPFSWEPQEVEVLDSGTLALSSGPVRDPGGKLFATFSSIWRMEGKGIWRIVFDKGNDVCDCAKP